MKFNSMKRKVIVLLTFLFILYIPITIIGCNQINQDIEIKYNIVDLQDDEILVELITELGQLITDINKHIYKEEHTYGNLQWESEVVETSNRINIVLALLHIKLNLLETNGIYKVSIELIKNINDSISANETLVDVNKNLFMLLDRLH